MQPTLISVELRKVLLQSISSVDHLERDNHVRRIDLIRLEIDSAFQQFQLTNDSVKLESDLRTLSGKLHDRLSEAAESGGKLRSDFHAKSDEIQKLERQLGKPAGGTTDIRQMTVLQFDMVGSSDVARILGASLGPESIALLNQKVAQLSDTALHQIGTTRAQVQFAEGGDGSMFAFGEPSQAFDFSQNFLECCKRENSAIASSAMSSPWRFYFRVGAATGDMSWESRGGGIFVAAGLNIIDAVRLQDACRPGELFVDEKTFQGMSVEQQRAFEEQTVQLKDKRGVEHSVRRCIFDSDAAAEAERIGLWHPKTKPLN